jgi:predicted dehydrogenase
MCRKRGRIVLVGVTGLNLSRDDFYKKELTFQVSCSYGPGRYDPAYEERGQDYPHGYVRWTAQRNFEAVLDMMADGRLNVEPLITHRFRFEQAAAAYNLIQSDTPHLGVLLQYSSDAEKPAEKLLARTIRLSQSVNQPKATPCLGVIGAGAYATKVLIPAFRQAGAALGSIASTGGVSAAHAGRKFGFQEITTDVHALIADSRFDTVIIVTRHDSHASLVCEALRSGKNVFVEKPLAVSTHQLDEIEAAYREACAQERMPRLMVGFNRRFAPHVARIKQLLGCSQVPKSFILTINAGKIPSDHWVQDPMIGGGRIIGEACHFIDLLRFLAGAGITRVSGGRNGPDNISFTLNFADGSLGTVHYLTTGDKSFPKERLEVFAGGRILQLDNFRRLRGYGWPGFRSMNLWRQNKGATEMVAAFVNAVREGAPSPIPFEELLEVARVTLQVAAL